MKLLRTAALLLTAAAGITGLAHAQSNTFTLLSKGATVGKCVYSFDKTKDGFKISSRYQARVAGQARATTQSRGGYDTDNPTSSTNEVQQTNSYKLDANYSYAGGSILDGTNQMNNGYSPNKTKTVMQLSMIQGGVQGASSELALKPGFIVMPNYDASVIQSLLYQATAHPTPDNLYFLIVPGAGRGGPQSVQAKWVPQPDTTGKLAGAPVALHHFSFAFGKNVYDVYADATNTLMEADVSGLSVSFVRTGFALDTPTPAASAPTAK